MCTLLYSCVLPPLQVVRGATPICLPSLDDSADGAAAAKCSVSSHLGDTRQLGSTLSGSGQAASWRSLMCPPQSPAVCHSPVIVYSCHFSLSVLCLKTKYVSSPGLHLALSAVSRIIAPPRRPHPNPPNLCLCYITKGFCR